MKKTIALTTVEQARKYHRYMWRWLSKHPGRGKDDWPGWKVIERVNSHCFACWVGVQGSGSIDPEYKCPHCPIEIWKSDKCICGCDKKDQLYREWRLVLCKIAGCELIDEKDLKKLSRFAAEISELSWK